MYSSFLLIQSLLCHQGPAKKARPVKAVKVYLCLLLFKILHCTVWLLILWGLNNCGFCEVFLFTKNTKFYIHGI